MCFVRINQTADGMVRSALVKPSNPVMDLGVARPPAARAYSGEGILHIVMGWDHLCSCWGSAFWSNAASLGVAHQFPTLAQQL